MRKEIPTADLEISLHRWYAESYAIELRFRRPNSDVDIPPVRAVKVQVDFDALRENSDDIAAYGELLAEILFSDTAIRDGFVQARTVAQEEGLPLRFRLFIAPSAPELSDLRWETLRDPQTKAWLLTNENVFFSRYLSTSDWRQVRLRSRNDLRALAVIASPSDLDKYPGRSLAPLDIPAELNRVETALSGIPVTTIGATESASLNNICNELREEHDILYLVCHGALIDREPKLWLEDSQGKTDVVDGGDLVSRLNDLQHRPKLVVLASCQSAGKGDDVCSADEGALAGLGPRLVMEAGIPAVLAMQGNVTVGTVSRFMGAVFTELKRDGQIDRAMAVARGSIRDRDDSWMPVLFMRLTSGRIWYEPGFAGDKRQPGFNRWLALLDYIKNGNCTPIIGSGFLEPIVGSTREIARRWSEAHHYPMAPRHVEDLTQVAEYLAVSQSEDFARSALRDALSKEILRRYGKKLPVAAKPDVSMEELITSTGALLRHENESEPHNVLARLPFPIYITTNPDSLLTDALREAGKDPQIELCRWNDELDWPPSIYETNPDYKPTKEKPLVYYLFGGFQVRESVVLTEDNYFDYLIGITRNDNPMPSVVRKALADSALLFLGFQLDDWDFRVIFRSIMGQEGRGRRKKYVHVAVQIDPEESQILDSERARRYLLDRFEGAHINIYWGSVDDFVKELQDYWLRRPAVAGNA